MPLVLDVLQELGVNAKIEGAQAETLQKELEKENAGNSNWKRLSWNENNIPTGRGVSHTPKKSKAAPPDDEAERIRIAEAEMEMEIAIMEMELEMGEYKAVAGIGTIEDVPRGKSQTDIKNREKIILKIYSEFEILNPDKRIFNKYLNDYIYINSDGKNETKHHAARSYNSTIALFFLSEILKNATIVGTDNPHSKKQQKLFEFMYLMEWQGFKLTVGVTHIEKKKIQYCLSLIE
jgi:hypothetical protein